MSGVTIIVEPVAGNIDDPFSIRINGLPPNTLTRITSRTTDDNGRVWTACATFSSDGLGIIDLGRDVPVFGSYKVADPAGLIWSMTPTHEPLSGTFSKATVEPMIIGISVTVDDEIVASAELQRQWCQPGVTMSRVEENGLFGQVFWPKSKNQVRGVIVLGGTSGSVHSTIAASLASRGFAAMALAYFGQPSLPESHSNIPIEYFSRAIDWLLDQPRVSRNEIGLFGISRGGEAALLTAAHDLRVKAVVSYNGSGVLFQSWNVRGGGGAAWTHRGEALPYLPISIDVAKMRAAVPQRPFATTEQFRRALDDIDSAERATIPVEKIAGPVLLVAGADDAVWPSLELANRMEKRLKSHGFQHQIERLNYEGAGHHLGHPYVPASVTVSSRGNVYRDLGGNGICCAAADADAWPRVVKFFRENVS